MVIEREDESVRLFTSVVTVSGWFEAIAGGGVRLHVV